eukprot:gene25176-32845_t
MEFHTASESKQQEFPDYLLSKNQLPSNDNIDLFYAALEGSHSKVNSLLKNGAKPNFFHRPEDNKNSLHVASEHGYDDIVELLIKHDAVVDGKVTSTYDTPLLLACRNNHITTVQLLIKHGANVNTGNCYGNTALHEAAREGHTEILKVLIDSGAKVNIQNKKGSTPLHFGCYGESKSKNPLDIIVLLVKAGSDVNHKDFRDITPLLVCCISGRLDILNYLKENGADPTAKDVFGRDAYALAVFNHHKHIADLHGVESPFKRFS